jgi:hypothetical protein
MLGHLHPHQRAGDEIDAGAAVLGRNVEAPEAHRAHLSTEAREVLRRQLAGVGIELGLQRHDLLAHKRRTAATIWRCSSVGSRFIGMSVSSRRAPLMREMVSGEWETVSFRMASASPHFTTHHLTTHHLTHYNGLVARAASADRLFATGSDP